MSSAAGVVLERGALHLTCVAYPRSPPLCSGGLEEVSDDMSAGGASGDSDFFDGAAAAKADASDSGFGHSFEDQGSGGGLEKQYPFVDSL